MQIHHLNCGTFCPLSHPLVNRFLPGLDRLNLVCHCLLIETNAGLVLVDTGLGLEDVRNQKRLLMNFYFNQLAKPKLDLEETAFMQIIRQGFKPSDVKHIIVSHFDSDHVGGLVDFPEATIHILEDEWEYANHPQSLKDKARYRQMIWEKNRKVKTYKTTGDNWHQFAKIQALEGLPPELALISLPGHSRGHAGVWVEGSKPLFFAGDAFMLETQLTTGKSPLPLKIYNKLVHDDEQLAQETLIKLKNFQEHHPHVPVVCSHDRNLYLKQLRNE